MSATIPAMTWWEFVAKTAGSTQQNEIAEAAGVSQATVSRWKSGAITRASADVAVSLARYYGAPVGDALVAARVLNPDELPVTTVRHEDPSDEELLDLIRARFARTGKEAGTNDPAATNTAPTDGAPDHHDVEEQDDEQQEPTINPEGLMPEDQPHSPDDYGLAARHGTPASPPDTTTGEESQDPGSDDPA